MKILSPFNLYFLFFLFFSVTCISQVGINTNEPTSTLDVNGSVRIRVMDSNESRPINATKIVGMDDEGNFVEVEMAKNIDLINNRLVVTDRILEMGGLATPLIAAQNHNVSLRILPGAANHGRSIIRIETTIGDTEITGIEAAPDGTHIWLYAVSGKLTLAYNSPLSLPANRIERNDKMVAKQYEMLELVYDGIRGIWIVMQNHS